MTRTKRVLTRFTSAQLLARALREEGLHGVEEHATPEPLVAWNGKATGEIAQVIVRRAGLGATADDVGFALRTDGSFEAVLSDIHAFRFDRRFFESLEKRRMKLEGEATSAPQGPELFSMPKARAAEPARRVARDAPSAVAAPAPGSAAAARDPLAFVPPLPVSTHSDAAKRSAPAPAHLASSHVDSSAARVHEQLDEILARAERELRRPLGNAGKLIVAVSVALAIVLLLSNRGLGGVLCVGLVTFMLVVIAAGIRAQQITQLAVADFRRAFPTTDQRQDLVLRYLSELPKSRHDRLKGVLKAILDACHAPQSPPPLRVRR